MQIFPTQYSLLSAVALKDELEEKYGLSNAICKLLIHNVGDTYLLETLKAKYIFKIYRDSHRKLDEIEGELELLNALHRGGARVAIPIQDLKGNLIQAFNAAEGTRHGVLFTYANGQVIQELNDGQLTTLGREVAIIHGISAKLELSHSRKDFDLNSMVFEPLKQIKPSFKGLEAEYEDLVSMAGQVTEKIVAMDLDSFAKGYCHYDLLPKNFHFDQHGAVTFFDFDFAGKGYLVNDLASFYAHYFLLILHQKISQEEADRAFAVFIKGYRSVRPLSEAEFEAIPYFGFCWWVFYFGFHYDNFDDWSNFFFGPRFIKERVGWIRKWFDWYLAPI
ncbi:phosphotransferase enzyme family protein [Pedobacter psychroterrae]|uniref:Aminoglycoside phosphotransferase domain-containing protein n=1 Tax=Pedobacter psychroterrae TaxID=2530453 RepID=A0A4R0NCZ1_9SPHI|nr:phosphotransferase [Pedobacter psychroterrae]TCC98210.1 hypothetical protein EZ437_18640 [Pedobacter psychroterrae]